MLSFILKLIKKIFNKSEVVINPALNFDYTKYDQEIENKKRNIELFEKIVGDNPMKRLDWIISNGLEKFNYWEKLCETGAIYSPATVEKLVINESSSHIRLKNSALLVDDNGVKHVSSCDRIQWSSKEDMGVYYEEEISGGIGNKVLYTYKQNKSAIYERLELMNEMTDSDFQYNTLIEVI